MSAAVAERPNKPPPFWRMENPEFDPVTKAVVVGGMNPRQREWWRLKNFVRLFVGGYGSGKTLIGCKRAISMALLNAPHGWAVVSPTFEMARETTILTIEELLAGKEALHRDEGFSWRYNKNEHVFHIQDGWAAPVARILIKSGEIPANLKGPNLAGASIDEPFMQHEEVFRQMVARVRHPEAVRREINLHGTPEELNWGYELAIGEFSLKFDVGMVTASTRDNPALPEDFVPRLLGMYDAQAAKAYVEGLFVSLSSGLVYYAFDPGECMVAMERPPSAELGVGMDFNVNPMAAVVFWRTAKHMHVFDEIELPNSDTEYMCQELHKRGYYQAGLRNVYPDASGKQRHSNAPGGKTDFDYIEAAGFTVVCNADNGPRRDRYNAVNGKLKPRDERVFLTIDPNCKSLRKYLSVYSHAMMNKQKSMSHLLDAFSYPISYLYPATRPKVREFRLTGV